LLSISKAISYPLNDAGDDYKNTVDWNEGLESQLENESFISYSTYDALNRVMRTESPHNATIRASITRHVHDESGALDQVYVSVHGETEKAYVQRIEYDAKGQRQLIRYGNGVETEYQYEADTYRLEQLISREGNKVWQDLATPMTRSATLPKSSTVRSRKLSTAGSRPTAIVSIGMIRCTG
jgi:hypothetical protein